MREPWGKLDLPAGDSHHLIHHSADVAAVTHELLLLPASWHPPFRPRAAGRPWHHAARSPALRMALVEAGGA